MSEAVAVFGRELFVTHRQWIDEWLSSSRSGFGGSSSFRLGAILNRRLGSSGTGFQKLWCRSRSYLLFHWTFLFLYQICKAIGVMKMITDMLICS